MFHAKASLCRIELAQGKLIALKGNHELMMIESRQDHKYLDDWSTFGGKETLASYTNEGKVVIPARHWTFIEDETLPYYETETHFFVHANVQHDLSLEDQRDYELYWDKFDKALTRPHVSGKIMVCGHTPQREGLPVHHGHAICIDTWAYKGYWLTCLDVATGQYWQANEQAETREGWISG